MSCLNDIIKRLEELKMSTEEVGDILHKTGVLKNVYPINPEHYIVGEIQYVCAYNNSNWPVHEQIINLEPEKICFVDTCFVEDYAVFGELVSSFIMNNKKAKGIVVNGLMRDLKDIKRRQFPVWCKGITPIGCFNVQVNQNPEINRHMERNRAKYEGAIAVCDSSGVVIIPKDEINENFITRINHMHEQEKIWFDCVENNNWNTYDTVCLKKYLKENQ